MWATDGRELSYVTRSSLECGHPPFVHAWKTSSATADGARHRSRGRGERGAITLSRAPSSVAQLVNCSVWRGGKGWYKHTSALPSSLPICDAHAGPGAPAAGGHHPDGDRCGRMTTPPRLLKISKPSNSHRGQFECKSGGKIPTRRRGRPRRGRVRCTQSVEPSGRAVELGSDLGPQSAIRWGAARRVAAAAT